MDYGKTILINKMYNNNKNAYSQQGNNIVHEAINLLTDDNGRHFLYIVSSGKISNANKDNIGCCLLVRKSSWKETVEIVAKAEGLKYLEWNFNDCQDNNVKYGGLDLSKIFEKNIINGKIDPSKVCITFEAERIYFPKHNIYLTNDKTLETHTDDVDIYYTGTAQIMNTSQRLYVSKEHNDSECKYEDIIKLINQQDKWESREIPKLNADMAENEKNDFMHIIGQQYNELAYSNLFAYVFSKYPELFRKFCNDILKVKDLKDFKVEREYEHIDLLIHDQCQKIVIVIENKIHSGINGIEDKGDGELSSQLSKYRLLIEDGIKMIKKKDKKTGENITEDIKVDTFKEYKKHFLIFAPEYEINILKSFIKEKKLDNANNKYIVVSYKTIYDFYDKQSHSDPIITEFLLALKCHTKPVDNEVEDQMIQRMLKIINDSK